MLGGGKLAGWSFEISPGEIFTNTDNGISASCPYDLVLYIPGFEHSSELVRLTKRIRAPASRGNLNVSVDEILRAYIARRAAEGPDTHHPTERRMARIRATRRISLLESSAKFPSGSSPSTPSPSTAPGSGAEGARVLGSVSSQKASDSGDSKSPSRHRAATTGRSRAISEVVSSYSSGPTTWPHLNARRTRLRAERNSVSEWAAQECGEYLAAGTHRPALYCAIAIAVYACTVLWMRAGLLGRVIWTLVAFIAAFFYGPLFLGRLLTLSLRYTVLNGFPLDFGAVSVWPSLKGDGHLRLTVTAYDAGFGNPPDFPHKYFVSVGRVAFEASVCLSDIARLGLWRRVPWSPFPSVCSRIQRQDAGTIAVKVRGLRLAPPSKPPPRKCYLEVRSGEKGRWRTRQMDSDRASGCSWNTLLIPYSHIRHNDYITFRVCSKELGAHKSLIGEARLTVEDLKRLDRGEVYALDTSASDASGSGTLELTLRALIDAAGSVTWGEWSSDGFWNPFIVIKQAGSILHSSQVRNATNQPKWRPVVIPVAPFRSSSRFEFEVWHADDVPGETRRVATAEATLSELASGNTIELTLFSDDDNEPRVPSSESTAASECTRVSEKSVDTRSSDSSRGVRPAASTKTGTTVGITKASVGRLSIRTRKRSGFRLPSPRWGENACDSAALKFMSVKTTGLAARPAFLGVVSFDYIEFDRVMLNFETHRGEFNVNGVTRLIAEGEMVPYVRRDQKQTSIRQDMSVFGSVAERICGRKPGPDATPSSTPDAAASKDELPWPNCLEVRLIRARNLRGRGGRTPSPRVVVKVRRQKYQSLVHQRNANPLFNEIFRFVVTDPSSVLHVEVYDTGIVGSGSPTAHWVLTLKWLYINPSHCKWETLAHWRHDAKMRPGTIRGWFPVLDSELRSVGASHGEIEMEVSWHHKEGFDSGWNPAPLKALEQLTENSGETKLRLGNFDAVRAMLDAFPLLLNVRRVTIRDVSFFLKDLFLGYKGAMEKKGVKEEALRVDFLETAKLDPGAHTAAHTLESFLMVWTKSLVPKVMKKASLLGSATSQIMGGWFSSMFDWGYGRGSTPLAEQNKGSPAKKASLFGRLRRRIVNQLQKTRHWQTHLVTAHDTDYFLPVILRGIVEKRTSRQRNWVWALMELKGCTLFYADCDRKGNRLHAEKKLDLSQTTRVRLVKTGHKEIHISSGLRNRWIRVPVDVFGPSIKEWHHAMMRNMRREIRGAIEICVSQSTGLPDQVLQHSSLSCGLHMLDAKGNDTQPAVWTRPSEASNPAYWEQTLSIDSISASSTTMRITIARSHQPDAPLLEARMPLTAFTHEPQAFRLPWREVPDDASSQPRRSTHKGKTKGVLGSIRFRGQIVDSSGAYATGSKPVSVQSTPRGKLTSPSSDVTETPPLRERVAAPSVNQREESNTSRNTSGTAGLNQGAGTPQSAKSDRAADALSGHTTPQSDRRASEVRMEKLQLEGTVFPVVKYNQRGRPQKRLLSMDAENLYNVKSNGRKAKRPVIPLSTLQLCALAPARGPDSFILHFIDQKSNQKLIRNFTAASTSEARTIVERINKLKHLNDLQVGPKRAAPARPMQHNILLSPGSDGSDDGDFSPSSTDRSRSVSPVSSRRDRKTRMPRRVIPEGST